MTTMKAISAAIKLIDVKKENLRKAFDHLQQLQCNPSSLSFSFPLTWAHLDSHFTSIHSSLLHKFHLLQQQQQQSTTTSQNVDHITDDNNLDFVGASPELKMICQNMDWMGLRKYVFDRYKEHESMRGQLRDAYGCAPDAAALVLDAVEGFGESVNFEVKRSCVVLLEELMGMGMVVVVAEEVKKRAMGIAVGWKGRMKRASGHGVFEVLAFLLLVAAYGLMPGFSVDDVLDYLVVAAKNKVAVQLCRVLNLGDRIGDLISKFISNGKQILAIKFIYEFEMTEKFPPVPLLKAYDSESKVRVQKIFNGRNQRYGTVKESINKEIKDLRAFIKCIEEYKLESAQYPTDSILQRIEKLEKEKLDRKRTAAAASSLPEQRQKPQKVNVNVKRQRTTEPTDLAIISTTDTTNVSIQKSVSSKSALQSYQAPLAQTTGLFLDHCVPPLTVPAGTYGQAGSYPTFNNTNLSIPSSAASSSAHQLYQQPPPAGLLPNHPDPAHALPPGSYGVPGSNPAIDPYIVSSAGMYDSSGTSMSFNGNVPSNGSNPYPSGPSMPAGYVDGQISYGGYAYQPEYRPYYP